MCVYCYHASPAVKDAEVADVTLEDRDDIEEFLGSSTQPVASRREEQGNLSPTRQAFKRYVFIFLSRKFLFALLRQLTNAKLQNISAKIIISFQDYKKQ